MKFSSLALTTLAASLLLVSTGSAIAGGNYKGEANYKDMAAPCPPPKMLMGGFYVGGQLGYDSYQMKETFSDNDGSSINPTMNSTGWVGGLFVGYGQYFSDYYYLGGEVFGNYSGAEESYTSNVPGVVNYSDKLSAQGSYGLSLLPGIRLNDATTGYIRLGYNWASIKSQANVSFAGGAATSNSKTNTSGGFNYGVGMETLLYQNWSARAEYTHTNYSSFNVGWPATTSNTNISPSDNQFMVGVLYHFA